MDPQFLAKLDDARDLATEAAGYPIPFVISSGFRCEPHDDTWGGKRCHTTGRAADIKIPNSRARYYIRQALLALGFNRFGTGQNFLHVDRVWGKDEDVEWVYKAKK